MSADVPVAIIGIGCNFPGGSRNKDLYYEFLRNKGDGMITPPPGRWIHEEWYGGKDQPGKYHTTKSGFIDGIDQFDCLEFGISAKEAAHTDPAIRLSLEAAQAALQDSGIDYRGSNTGVFFGNLLATDNELDVERHEINNYNGVGRSVSIRANRISFTFDLRGPSLTVDTACSASATAMHLALCSIRLGEVDQALVVGANTIIYPEHTVSFSKLGVLSPTGSSKSFDASADGYARAEGAAAVLVKRLDCALADGDCIYAIVKGSAINANGKGKSLTMPEGDRQAETIKEAYRVAGRDPSEAFFVELHATGTEVGDPIEANAAGNVFSRGRDAGKPLRVGSVKANIGHAEGCSFLASLVKVSLMLHHKEIIPNIRFNKANPKIDFPALKMRVQTELESITADMAASDGTWVTSISSYGVGGSNAHVVLESIEAVADLSRPAVVPVHQKKPLYLFPVGALTEAALGRWRDAIVSAYNGIIDDRTLRSVARALARQTRAYPSRAFVVGSSLDASLKFSRPVLRHSNVSPKLCLVFAGQGPQHIYMGRQLAENYPAFLSAIQENDRVLVEKYSQRSMLERTGLFLPGVECKLPTNGVWPVQEVVLSLVFIQVALVDLVRSLGIKYDFVVGHSIGEIAMGYASGHYDREMAIGIAVARAAAMTRAEDNGAMVALGVGVQRANTMIRKVLSRVKASSGLWIAGINSPQAVTVAGSHALINAIIKLANDPTVRVFAAKLRVTCAFHTPLMEPQEQLFRERVGETRLSQGTRTPVARVMSTTDGKWLDRDLDINYCWDNIRRPVLFGTAINKIVSDEGSDGVRFLEIAPHPVLKAYIEQCGGEAITLIRRPNSKVPAPNTGEHYQLLEGIGDLLCSGFKNVDFDELYGSPVGVTDFVKVSLPDYPYSKSYCWGESQWQQSRRLREHARPLAPSHFRISVETHPDLTGHVVFDTVLFPASGYVEGILENGAMVVNNIAIHKPLVLAGSGSLPGHAGCVINGNKWEFKAATTPHFNNGVVTLDSVYASGSFSRVNPDYDENIPRMFDFQAKLARSQGSVAGDEFYAAIPSAYQYKGHFRNCLKVVHEVDDETCWGNKAYLTYLDIQNTDVFGRGYVIHPGILDSITQCGLAMFINMGTKQFDFNGIFLPVKIGAIRRWDSRDAPDLDHDISKGIWTYCTTAMWMPSGPFKSDYIVANAEGKVLFTIEGFEIARAPHAEPIPITDDRREERLTTVWQPKSFPSSLSSLPLSASLRSIFESLARDAAVSGRKVVRVADVAKTADIAIDLDAVLEALVDESGVVVEYHCVSGTPSDADAKTEALHYPRAKSLVLESWDLGEDVADTVLSSYDVVLCSVDLAAVPPDLLSITNFVGRGGVVVLSVTDSGTGVEDANIKPPTLPALTKMFTAIGGSVVHVSDLVDGKALLYVKVLQPTLSVPLGLFKTVIIQPFEHGREEELVEIVENISSEAELWITGNDDAAGIGALGIASCLIAESPEYKVYSVLFEDHSLNDAARERIVHDLRKNVLLLEQHMKISRSGDVLVRRLVHGGVDVKDIPIPSVGVTTSGSLAAYFPPSLSALDVEIEVKALGVEPGAPLKSALTFVGVVKSRGTSVARVDVGTEVVGITAQAPADIIVVPQDAIVALPKGVSFTDATALPVTFLSAWIGLVSRASISTLSTVLVHDGASAVGSAAIQVAKRFGAKVFSTAKNEQEAQQLSSRFGVSTSSIDNFSVTAAQWAKSGSISHFDVILNSSGMAVYTRGSEYLSPFGSYIHVQANETPEIPRGTVSLHILDINHFAAVSPAFLVPAISAILSSHASEPFVFSQRTVTMSGYNVSSADDVNALVIVPEANRIAKIDSNGQLFDPRKSYILVGGSSELGVRISEWMVQHGARHIFLTSRRGPKALTKTDNMYVQSMREAGVQVEVIAADANDRVKTTAIIARARESGPIGGIFVMTVVLRDAKFTNLTQQSFDDVYQSKVAVVDTLLSCVDPMSIDFMLLFSTIGSVFGNAGQAAYCASQLYLDRIADQIPNVISMSLPPITDSGVFKRLMLATKGGANTAQLTKTGMTTAQVCNFIGDSLIRKISHYVPMLAINDVSQTFPTCEPLLYGHLLQKQYLATGDAHGNGNGQTDSPASLLAALLSMDIDQISENALITSFGLDSLGATRYSSQLKSHLGIQVSQIQLLDSMTISTLNGMLAKTGVTSASSEDLSADDVAAKYGHALVPVPNDRLAYGEPYTSDASPHQYRIWLAQRERDNSRRRAVSKIDPSMSRYGATLWDTHEGYLVIVSAEVPLDGERMSDAMLEVIRRHGALRTAFTWNEGLEKLEQTVYPDIDFKTNFVDLSGEPDSAAKAYEISLALNMEPNFKLDCLPLLAATMFDLGNNRWAFNIVVHHIIIDESSLGIFFSEMFKLYLDGPDSLPDVTIHYSDFSDWLLKTSKRRAELREQHLQFWSQKLDDMQPLHLTLATPSDRELAPITQIEARIGVGPLEQYMKMITSAAVTPFAGFFATYNILLHKYSGQSSFAVGTAVTQRNLQMLTNVIGFFANMLPIKTVIDEAETFAEYLKEFKTSLIASLAHDEVTYEDLVGLGKSSVGSRGYFKHLFALGGRYAMAFSQHDSNHINVESVLSLPLGEEKYEFLLTVHPNNGQVVLRFDNHLYTEDAARQFLDAYISLVETLGKNPESEIRNINVVSEREHQRLIKEFSSTADVAVNKVCLHHLVEEQTKRTPHLTAVEFEEESLTYEELNSTANRVALSLIECGVNVGDVVALCFDRGISQIIAVLAVLKAGCAFLPLDPDDPTIRKELMITECGAKVVLTTTNHFRTFQKSLASKVLIAYINDPSYKKRLFKFSAENFDVEGLSPSSLAYIMFTSGSTGKPKGVMIEHRSIANLVQNSGVYGFMQGARVMSSLAYTFDPFVVDMFGTLTHGATLVAGKKELVLGDIPTALRSLRITVLHVTPSILAVVPVEQYPCLETIVVAGEALGKKLIEDWSGRVTLRNMYGPTEASVDCVSCHVISPSFTGVIGRPLPNCRAYILDKHLRPTPVGVEGELYIGGIQLARGYLNQPELTSQVFIPNPFFPGERIYKSGDIALYRTDGNIEYCGRADRQIKLRGQRIELGEIEDTIAKYSVVQRSAVIIRTMQDAPAIVAFVEFKVETLNQVEDHKEGLKVFVAERLPRFMYPSIIAALPRLPMSQNGKINRIVLSHLDLTPFNVDFSTEIGSPSGDIETELMNIFSKILKIQDGSFGVAHDLFAAGLNSLMAVQAAGVITKTFGVHIGLNHIYLRPTIRELSTLIIDAMGQDSRAIMEAEDTDADYLIEFLPIKKKGIRPRLFFVHDVTGMATPFMRIGAYMPNEMYAIGDKHFGSATGFASVESMADHYITLIKSVQPHGPYIISGYSFGGQVAICMADKLVQAGETVDHLILLDPLYIPSAERTGLKATGITQRLMDRLSAIFAEIGEKWKNKLCIEVQKNLESMFEYDPPHYEGRATLVVPKDRSWFRASNVSDFGTGADDYNGWRSCIKNLDLKISAGAHVTMFAPAHVKVLAGVIKEIIGGDLEPTKPVMARNKSSTAF